MPPKARHRATGPVLAWYTALVMPLAVAASGASTQPAPATATTPTPAALPATRCGWFDNPTPGNATLTDRDGEWLVGQQGAHQSIGSWPQFAGARWVRTGRGSSGYGCACIKFVQEPETQNVKRILSARALPLAACRSDKALKGLEPENPLK